MQSSRNIIIGIVGAVIIIGGLIWLSNVSSNTSESSNVASGGSLSLEETKFDFGTISMANGVVTHDVKITNTGSTPVTISKLYTSCMCTKVSFMNGDKKLGPFGMPGHGIVPTINETLEPGAESTVEVAFDPNAHGPAGVGRIDRVVTIENSTGVALKINFSATVTP